MGLESRTGASVGGDQAWHPNRHKGPLKRLDLKVLHGYGARWVRIWDSVVFEDYVPSKRFEYSCPGAPVTPC